MPTIYKTKDGTLTGFVPGVGLIVDGKITVPEGVVIENANFEKVEGSQFQNAPAAPSASNPLQQGIPQVDPQTPREASTSSANQINKESN